MASTGRRNSEPAVSSIVRASVLDSARTNTNEHVDVLFLSVVRPNDVKKPLIAMYQQKKKWSKITEEIHFSLRNTDMYQKAITPPIPTPTVYPQTSSSRQQKGTKLFLLTADRYYTLGSGR